MKEDKTRWQNGEFTRAYRNSADDFIPDRQRFINTAVSFYQNFIMDKGRRILDLGSGDGILTEAILALHPEVEATLVDLSPEMIEAARRRFKGRENVSFINSSFEELIEKEPLTGPYDFVVSSLAIHHICLKDKERLFSYIYKVLSAGGAFINIDTVLSPSEDLEEWYMKLWTEWVKDTGKKWEEEGPFAMPTRYRENLENTPDTLESQLAALKKAGFGEVDCFLKFGIFTAFGGRKQG